MDTWEEELNALKDGEFPDDFQRQAPLEAALEEFRQGAVRFGKADGNKYHALRGLCTF